MAKTPANTLNMPLEELLEVTEVTLGWTRPASAEDVKHLTGLPEGPDTRSGWVWVRLRNGDLYLALAPCGETYDKINNRPEGPQV